MTTDLADLDVFYGDLTAARAYVYARLPRPADDAGLTLAGQVCGPRCKLAQTLPVTSPLVDLGPGPTLLARALVPDPVFWSPDLPAIYDVTVNLLRGAEVIATAHRQIGLRSLGVRGRDLMLNGKRWVLRGVATASTSASSPREWHQAQAAYASDDLGLDDLTVASDFGVLSMIHVAEPGGPIVPRLRRLAQFPAAAIAVFDQALPPDFRKLEIAPNLLFAQLIIPEWRWPRQPWADLLAVGAGDEQLIAETLTFGDIPIIATRFQRPPVDLETARAACDALQRDLAPLGQFAGYVV
jgi:hypothetical protein